VRADSYSNRDSTGHNKAKPNVQHQPLTSMPARVMARSEYIKESSNANGHYGSNDGTPTPGHGSMISTEDMARTDRMTMRRGCTGAT
jgi:hypothetical protein